MRTKTVLAAVIGAACLAAPVLAIGSHGPPSNGGKGNGSMIGAPGHDPDFSDGFWFTDGNFANFVSPPGGPTQFQFGSNNGSDDDISLICTPNTPHGVPASTTNTFQLDWNLNNSCDPFIALVIDLPNTGQETFWLDDDAPTSSPFTTQNLSHGFTRIFYNGFADGIPAGSTINTLAFSDYVECSNTFDAIQNVFVNGRGISLNLQAPNDPPPVNSYF